MPDKPDNGKTLLLRARYCKVLHGHRAQWPGPGPAGSCCTAGRPWWPHRRGWRQCPETHGCGTRYRIPGSSNGSVRPVGAACLVGEFVVNKHDLHGKPDWSPGRLLTKAWKANDQAVHFKSEDGIVGTSAPRLCPRADGYVSVTAASYVTTAQQGLAGLWQRSRYRTAMPDAVVCAAVHDAGWRRERALRTVTDTAVFIVSGPRGETGVLKVTTTESGMAGLSRERDVLRQLWSDERLGDWRAVLPVPLDAGDAGAGAFLLTSRLPGRVGRDLPAKTAGRLTLAAVDAISPLHRRTQTVRVVDETLLAEWVDQPVQRIKMALPSDGVVGRLAGALRADLAGRPLMLGWTHGDFHPGNLLVSTDGPVTGIVDWGEARKQDLAVLDLAFWLLTVPAPGQPREFGKRIAARLNSGQFWTPAETQLLSDVTDSDLAAGRTLLLLAWLRHVASNLGKSSRYASSPLWLRWNVIPVLRQVANG